MLVTALQVTSLLFALPIYARLAQHRVTRWEWTWAVLLAGSLAVLVTVGDPGAGTARGSVGSWLAVAAVMGPVLVLCVLGARIWASSTAAPVLLAVVAGSSLALFAVLTKGAFGQHRLASARFFAHPSQVLPAARRPGGNDLLDLGLGRARLPGRRGAAAAARAPGLDPSSPMTDGTGSPTSTPPPRSSPASAGACC